MMISALVAALLAPPLAPPAAPQERTSVTAADPAALAEAIRLLDDEGFEEQTLRSAAMTVELMVTAMASEIQNKTGEPVPGDFLQQLRQIMVEHSNSTLRANMNAIKQQAAAIYAQEFTPQELVRLRQLATDPVMVKARERSKVMEPKLMALGAQTMRASQPELEAKINRLIAEHLAHQERGADRS